MMRNLLNSIVITFGVFIVFLIAGLFFAGCSNEEVKPIDLNLFDGNWEVGYSVDQDLFGSQCILEISTSYSDEFDSSFGIKRGKITTYYINGTGTKFYDKVFRWSIGETQDSEYLLILELEEALDSEDPWAGRYFYKITKLNNTHMWWQAYSSGSGGTIKMRRRTDLN